MKAFKRIFLLARRRDESRFVFIKKKEEEKKREALDSFYERLSLQNGWNHEESSLHEGTFLYERSGFA